MDEKKKIDDSNISFSDIASKYIPDEQKNDDSVPTVDNTAGSDSVAKKGIMPDSAKVDAVKKSRPNLNISSEKASKTNEFNTNSLKKPLYKSDRLNQNGTKFDLLDSMPLNEQHAKQAKFKDISVKKAKKEPKDNDKKQRKSLISRIDVSRFTKDTYIFFGVVIVLSIAISVYAVLCINDLFGMTKSKDSISVVLTDEEINSSSKTIDVLRENKLINCPTFCKIFAKIRTTFDKDGDRKSSSLGPPYTASTFELNGKMGIEGMLMTMQGGVAEKETVTVTIPEGYTIPQLLKKLVDSEVYSASEISAFEKALNEETSTYALTSGLQTKEEVPFKFEGYLFPETYTFYKNEKPKSVLNKFFDTIEKKITKEDREKAEQMGLTMEQVIILASIIEKEAGTKAQMPVISKILHNRIADKMQLGCNSTLDYIKNSIAPTLTVNSKHSSSYYEEKYNTYTVNGLPPSPICNPGMNAINAVLNPDAKSSKLMYFCHDLKGNMYTSETYEQHKINVINHVGK